LKSSIKVAESKNTGLEDQLAAAKKKIDEQQEEIAKLYQLQDKSRIVHEETIPRNLWYCCT